jgi:hypothetical protein
VTQKSRAHADIVRIFFRHRRRHAVPEQVDVESMTFCGVPRTSGTAGANLVG